VYCIQGEEPMVAPPGRETGQYDEQPPAGVIHRGLFVLRLGLLRVVPALPHVRQELGK
jgi:hypothetical protein